MDQTFGNAPLTICLSCDDKNFRILPYYVVIYFNLFRNRTTNDVNYPQVQLQI